MGANLSARADEALPLSASARRRSKEDEQNRRSLAARERYQPTMQEFFVLKLNRRRTAKRKLGPDVCHARQLRSALRRQVCLSCPRPFVVHPTRPQWAVPILKDCSHWSMSFRSNPSTGSGIAPFRMKPRKGGLGKQYQLARAGGIEPPNGGIKIR